MTAVFVRFWDRPILCPKEKDQEAFRKRYFWAYEPTNGEGNNAVPIKLLMMPDGKMMSSERRAMMDAACADRPKIGDHRPNQVRRHPSLSRGLEKVKRDGGGRARFHASACMYQTAWVFARGDGRRVWVLGRQQKLDDA